MRAASPRLCERIELAPVLVGLTAGVVRSRQTGTVPVDEGNTWTRATRSTDDPPSCGGSAGNRRVQAARTAGFWRHGPGLPGRFAGRARGGGEGRLPAPGSRPRVQQPVP